MTVTLQETIIIDCGKKELNLTFILFSLRCNNLFCQLFSNYTFPFLTSLISIYNNHHFQNRIPLTAYVRIIFIFVSDLNKDDIHSLFFLATKYGLRVGKPNLHPIRYIYRNKPDHYFNNIRFQRDGIMEPYLKSNGGEQGSVLNGRLKGLFFSTLVDPLTNMPYDFSYFGNIRLYVEASYLFHPNCNLYFSDFYCHTKRHHVTLVLTPKSSPTNELCRKYLLQLDILNNPYLHIFRYNDGSFCVLANMNVVVQIFYTDPIDISSLLEIGAGFMRRTPTKGRGYALPSGIPKNSSCVLCNLYR